MKITSPAPGYTGVDHYGATELKFENGVATFDGDLPDGVRQYLVGAGYGLGSSKPTQPEPAAPPPDPRDVSEEKVGTALRDAAVDPAEGDFLPPTNAGEPGELGNPHGPHVVSPGIHAVSGPGPIVPGPVGRFEEQEDGSRVVISDTEEQQRRETSAAEKVFVDQQPVPEATADLAEDAGVAAPEPGTAVSNLPSAADLKGQALEVALTEAGLPKSGTADEKRQRLVDAGLASA